MERFVQREGYTAVQILELRTACLRIMNNSKYSQDSLCIWKVCKHSEHSLSYSENS